MFIANYIDRVNIGFVRSHLAADIGLSTAAYGLGAGLFFIGYALLEVPSNILLARLGARAWITRIMLTWGVVAMAMAFVRGETSFYVLRFILGAAEAGFFPGVIWYLTRWLPAEERGRAMAIFLSGSAIASVIAGPVTGALLQLPDTGLRSWQWMFLVEGGVSVLLGAVTWFWLDSLPPDAKWLSDAEKQALDDVIRDEQARRELGRPKHVSIWHLLRDPQIAIFCFIYFSVSLTIYGATFWLPSMIKKIGHMSDLTVGFYNSVPWLISIVAMYAFAALARRFRFQQAWVAVALIIAAVGMYASTLGTTPLFAYLAICFAAVGFKAASSLFWPLPQNFLDQRIAAAVIALINSLGNLGGFVAPATFGFLEQHTGSIRGGMIGLSVVSVIAAVVVFFVRNPVSPVRPTDAPDLAERNKRTTPGGSAKALHAH
jgi:MFS family permease